MNWLFQKPDDMTYTDLCIWLDNNFYTEGCDMNTSYKYIWLICNMLACKGRYFTNALDYQDFSSYLAYDVYARMIDTNKPPIKSVLNYIKSIINFRKNAYRRESYSEIIDVSKPEYESFNDDLFKENYKSSIEEYNHARLERSIRDLLESIPSIIKNNIPKIYKNNKVEFENIYISCLLTLLNSYTLPNEAIKYLKEKESSCSTFNEVNYYRKHLDNEIILWHVPKTMETTIKVIINKTNSIIVRGIREISTESNISDDEFNSVVFSAMGVVDEGD